MLPLICIFFNFFSVLLFSKYRSFTSLLRFIPRYFILLEAIVSGIVFFSSLSASLLVYKNITDFWILILYPATLMNSLILVVFWWNLYGSLFTVSCHLQIKTFLLLLFQFGCFLLLLLVWSLWLGLQVLWWTREVKVNIPVLFPVLRGMLVVFAHWVWCWQWVCHIWPLLCLGTLPLFPLCWEFYHKWVLDFIKCFCCIYWYDHVVFTLHFVYVVNHIYLFANVVPTLHSQNKSHLIMVGDLSDSLLSSVCWHLVKGFSSMFIRDIGLYLEKKF